MLSILRSWGESLGYLAPSSLKAWGLLTLKGSMATYRLLFVRFWWFILFLGVSGWLFSSYRYATILWLLWCFLAVRPSIVKKDSNYFASYWAYCLVAFITMAAGAVLVVIIGYGNHAPYMVSYHGSCLLIIATVFALFFLFDAKLSFYSYLKSIWNGIKLVWYILPLTVLMCCVWKLVEYLIAYIVCQNWLSFFLVELFIGFLFPFFLHIFLYMYIKQIYGHPERYQ